MIEQQTWQELSAAYPYPLRDDIHPLWGFIPFFLTEEDERSVQEQFNERYVSGWNPFEGFTLVQNDMDKPLVIKYPGDPEYTEKARMLYRDQTIHMFSSSWVMVRNEDRTWEISRMD